MNATKLLTWIVFGLLALGAAAVVVLGTDSPGPGGRPGAASQTILMLLVLALWIGPTALFLALVAWLTWRPNEVAARSRQVLFLCLGVWAVFGLAESGVLGIAQNIYIWGFIFLLPAASLTAVIALFAWLRALRQRRQRPDET